MAKKNPVPLSESRPNKMRQHKEKVLAAKASGENVVRKNTPLATAEEKVLMRLADHKKRLKVAQSMQRKADLKAEYLPEYSGYIAGILEADAGGDNQVVVTILIWMLDAGQYAEAFDLASYVVRHELASPDGHTRDMPTVIAEEVADQYLRKGEATLEQLQNYWDLVGQIDMVDQVKAKLLKALGYAQRLEGELDKSKNSLQTALTLNDKVGVKKDIEAIDRELKAQAKAKAEAEAKAKAAAESKAKN